MKAAITVSEGRFLVRPDGDPEKEFEAEGSFDVEFDAVVELRKLGVENMADNDPTRDMGD